MQALDIWISVASYVRNTAGSLLTHSGSQFIAFCEAPGVIVGHLP